MKKNILFSIFAFVAVMLVLLPVNAEVTADKLGQVEYLSGGTATQNKVGSIITIEYQAADLEWAPAEPGIGRDVAGWWIGIKVKAPTDMGDTELQDATYTVNGRSGSFWEKKDSSNSAGVGNHFINMWKRVDKTQLEAGSDAVELIRYEFDWDNDTKVDEIVILKVKPDGITTKAPSAEYVTVEISGKWTFTIKKDETLSSLTGEDKTALEEIMTPDSGYKFVGLYDEANKKVDIEKTKFNQNAKLTIKFEKLPDPVPEKDNTPKTGVNDLLGISIVAIFLSTTGIVVLKKRYN